MTKIRLCPLCGGELVFLRDTGSQYGDIVYLEFKCSCCGEIISIDRDHQEDLDYVSILKPTWGTNWISFSSYCAKQHDKIKLCPLCFGKLYEVGVLTHSGTIDSILEVKEMMYVCTNCGHEILEKRFLHQDGEVTGHDLYRLIGEGSWRNVDTI